MKLNEQALLGGAGLGIDPFKTAAGGVGTEVTLFQALGVDFLPPSLPPVPWNWLKGVGLVSVKKPHSTFREDWKYQVKVNELFLFLPSGTRLGVARGLIGAEVVIRLADSGG